jgi:endonuclease III
MLAEPEAVHEAFTRRPALHRFVHTVPKFMVEACAIVLDEYDGDASAIWSDRPTAVELQERLRRFPGVSQKKAAMAVEMIERDLGIPIGAMEGSDVAIDVHVRRVFLRTGLVERDVAGEMVEAARALYPERPGALDLPAWIVGRSWCKARDPLCDECALGDVCPRLVARGDAVKGA